jgi:hypothetical protein
MDTEIIINILCLNENSPLQCHYTYNIRKWKYRCTSWEKLQFYEILSINRYFPAICEDSASKWFARISEKAYEYEEGNIYIKKVEDESEEVQENIPEEDELVTKSNYDWPIIYAPHQFDHHWF